MLIDLSGITQSTIYGPLTLCQQFLMWDISTFKGLAIAEHNKLTFGNNESVWNFYPDYIIVESVDQNEVYMAYKFPVEHFDS